MLLPWLFGVVSCRVETRLLFVAVVEVGLTFLQTAVHMSMPNFDVDYLSW